MKMFTKAALAAAAFAAIPAAAQAQVATADLDAAVSQSAAMKAARTAVQAQFKTQIDAFNAREQALQTELQPAVAELQTLQANPATAQATLQQKAAAYQTRAQAAQRELNTLSTPFTRPLAYAQEQVLAKIEPAVRAAMSAKNVTVLVKPDSVMAFAPAGDITNDVVAQIDAAVKTVSTTPPAGWQPGQQQQAAAGSAPAARPAPKTNGR